MTLRDRLRVPTVRVSGWRAAARRLSQGAAPELHGGNLSSVHASHPALFKPLTIPLFEPILMDQAIAALERRDVEGFLATACGNEYCIDLLAANLRLLNELEVYERGLLSALVASRTNNYVHRKTIPWLIAHADRTRLRAAGDPLPGSEPFRLYRGVAGRGSARHIRGISWTASPDCAAWFARRYHLPAPAVLRIEVEARHVLAYVASRGEQEFVIALPPGKRVVVHTCDSGEIEMAAPREQSALEVPAGC